MKESISDSGTLGPHGGNGSADRWMILVHQSHIDGILIALFVIVRNVPILRPIAKWFHHSQKGAGLIAHGI
jgi:hypothetical protein